MHCGLSDADTQQTKFNFRRQIQLAAVRKTALSPHSGSANRRLDEADLVEQCEMAGVELADWAVAEMEAALRTKYMEQGGGDEVQEEEAEEEEDEEVTMLYEMVDGSQVKPATSSDASSRTHWLN